MTRDAHFGQNGPSELTVPGAEPEVRLVDILPHLTSVWVPCVDFDGHSKDKLITFTYSRNTD